MKNASPFGEWLRKWRRARGFTQVQLARRAGCTQSIISEHERGVRQERGGEFMRPETDLVERLATALNRPVEEARALAGYLPTPEPPTLKGVSAILDETPGGGVMIKDDGQYYVITAEKMDEMFQLLRQINEKLTK